MAKDALSKPVEEIAHIRKEDRPASLSAEIPREKLPADLQKIIDREDDFMDEIYDGQGVDTTDTNLRYAAYANRLRTIMLSAHRYVAYTSDIGESFRPIAHPWLVRGAYGISWAYLIGDVSHEGYKAYKRNQNHLFPEGDEHKNATEPTVQAGTKASEKRSFIPAIEDYRTIMVQRALFQGIASMGLPAFTIHSIVKYSGKALKNNKNLVIRTWGPIGLGLAAVPALPYMFDKPVEEAIEWSFYEVFKSIGGEHAVGDRHSTGRKEALQLESKAAFEKQRARASKEL